MCSILNYYGWLGVAWWSSLIYFVLLRPNKLEISLVLPYLWSNKISCLWLLRVFWGCCNLKIRLLLLCPSRLGWVVVHVSSLWVLFPLLCLSWDEQNDPNYASMDLASMLRIFIYLTCKGPLIGVWFIRGMFCGKRDNLLVETDIICHFRDLILCNVKRLQFHWYK